MKINVKNLQKQKKKKKDWHIIKLYDYLKYPNKTDLLH